MECGQVMVRPLWFELRLVSKWKKEWEWEKEKAIEGQVVECLGCQTNEFGHDSWNVKAYWRALDQQSNIREWYFRKINLVLMCRLEWVKLVAERQVMSLLWPWYNEGGTREMKLKETEGKKEWWDVGSSWTKGKIKTEVLTWGGGSSLNWMKIGNRGREDCGGKDELFQSWHPLRNVQQTVGHIGLN